MFKRNIHSFNQVKNLISKIKKLTKNNRFPIIIDEEGKNVSRLKNIINHNISANFLEIYIKKIKFCIVQTLYQSLIKFKNSWNKYKYNSCA